MPLQIPGKRRRRNIPQLRTLQTTANERHASWLELFFDLVFVFAVSQIAVILLNNSDLFGLLKYSVLFISIWYSWVGFTFYADRFETEETSYRILTFGGMLAVTAFSLTFGGAFTAAGDTAFLICFILVRAFLLILYARAAYFVPLARVYCVQFIKGLGISVALVAISYFFDAPVKYYFWAAAMLTEFAIPFFNIPATRQIPIDRSHIPERFGLFTIIVLGEVVIGAARGASLIPFSWAAAVVASLGFGMAAGIWWINFEFVEENAVRSNSLIKRFTYLYGHFFIVASIVAAGIGVEHAIIETAEPHLHLATLALICGGVAIYLATVTVIRMVTGICNLFWIRAAAILISLAMIPIGQFLPPVIVMTLLFFLMAASIWIEGRYVESDKVIEEEAPHITPCVHEPAATVFKPRTGKLECEECVKNNYKWVHLRLCLSCGHVGCCDSSKYTHATKHFHAEEHPLMASLEPGENWAWCYIDERFVPTPTDLN